MPEFKLVCQEERTKKCQKLITGWGERSMAVVGFWGSYVTMVQKLSNLQSKKDLNVFSKRQAVKIQQRSSTSFHNKGTIKIHKSNSVSQPELREMKGEI